ncbi:MAG: plasmid stabilization protein [Omnitrophica WOR_2 bacterium GWF2_43_52]|nr:MAG: plasmid stabilization protein [Omnitrophica WOR_2 bacterium GWC2_44_8]OGX20659.1 MAG: plasmid stabilization protein [Omnitrophica WOR_2 bacterium GWF2_43_52]OGX53113.1 MAG: plasmid stabilization protein [Omnitrophica WOR_2 bacterium RIFOXYC2_FULL_43_9]HAH21339.1 plasmid stabilization protein [Candidatus Omnitrophota bacterium]HBG64312.1 plasmid stabilization protein [Candidatus Omnitrophota bacterium]
MKIEILEIAQREFRIAKEFYEFEQSGLGARFENEIKQALFRIRQHPAAWPSERREIRRCLIHRFPYKIIYSVQKEIIVILAFAHLHRKPDYWVDRIN